MSVFVDTSALLAVLDEADRFHPAAASTWRSLLEEREDLVSTNYVLIEAFALVQKRLGLAAVRVLEHEIVPVLRLVWLDRATHQAAVAALLAAGRRRLSLVDCTSFEAMQALGIDHAFAFDRHFAEQGFELLP